MNTSRNTTNTNNSNSPRLKPTHVWELKKGDEILEKAYGRSIALRVNRNPVEVRPDSWEVTAYTLDLNVVSLLETKGLSHYGPKLYKVESDD